MCWLMGSGRQGRRGGRILSFNGRALRLCLMRLFLWDGMDGVWEIGRELDVALAVENATGYCMET